MSGVRTPLPAPVYEVIMKTIAFLVQSEMTWNCFADLYKECKTRDDVNTLVFAVPTNVNIDTTSKKANAYNDDVVDVLNSKKIKFTDLSIIKKTDRVQIIENLNVDLLITSSKDDGMFVYPFGITVKEFSETFKVAYVPYYGATIIDDPHLHTRAAGHKYFWRFVVDSDMYKQYFVQKGVDESKIISFGHPKIESIAKIRKTRGKWPIPNGADKLKIIWAPHWSCPQFMLAKNGTWRNTSNFSTFLDNCWDFYRFADENEDTVQIVFRPHPFLKRWLAANESVELFTEFLNAWNMLPNVSSELTGLYNDLFASSDVLVTDGISFLVEYPIATGKPVIFIDNTIHENFNELGKLMEPSWNVVNTFSQVENLLYSPDQLKPSDGSIIIDYLLPYNGQTSKKIIDKLLDDLNEV